LGTELVHARARMAERLLQAHQVSDLCIGKPALRWLPPPSTVPDAIVAVWVLE